MRLSKFILSNLEEILTEWESFASTVFPENQFDRAACFAMTPQKC